MRMRGYLQPAQAGSRDEVHRGRLPVLRLNLKEDLKDLRQDRDAPRQLPRSSVRRQLHGGVEAIVELLGLERQGRRGDKRSRRTLQAGEGRVERRIHWLRP